jgi:RNA polymerase sigma factor (sigma-70 family)
VADHGAAGRSLFDPKRSLQLRPTLHVRAGSAFSRSNVIHGMGEQVKELLEERGCAAEALRSRTDAAAQLFREQNGPLVAYLTSRLRSAQEAREVAQEAFARLLQLPWSSSPSRLVRDYLFKTARHLAIDRLRHETVRRSAQDRELLEPHGPETDDPVERLVAREHAEALLGFLQELPAKCQQVLELHRLEGLTQQAVGKRLGLSDRMVRRYVSYAVVYCRLRLDGLSAAQARQKMVL